MKSPGYFNGDHLSMIDLITHYDLIGLAIGVAIGIAGKEFVFSLANDIFMPSLGFIWKTNNFLQRYEFKPSAFISHTITLLIVILVILMLLSIVLRPIVKKEIRNTKEKEAKDQDYQDKIKKSLARIRSLENRELRQVHSIKKNLDQSLNRQHVGYW